MSFRTDAPSPCGCNPVWVDSPSGPKAECQCDGTPNADHADDNIVEKARLDMTRRNFEAGRRPGTGAKR